jgi:putative endonuclease
MRGADSTADLGRLGESVAQRALEAEGYAVLATRFRSRYGEIDIVCDEGGVLVFVEVKARRTGRSGTAAEAITRRKRRRIAAMALDYLAREGRLDVRCRFDVVAIDRLGTPEMTVRIIRNAFTGEPS